MTTYMKETEVAARKKFTWTDRCIQTYVDSSEGTKDRQGKKRPWGIYTRAIE
jgi:hypothetical protein